MAGTRAPGRCGRCTTRKRGCRGARSNCVACRQWRVAGRARQDPLSRIRSVAPARPAAGWGNCGGARLRQPQALQPGTCDARVPRGDARASVVAAPFTAPHSHGCARPPIAGARARGAASSPLASGTPADDRRHEALARAVNDACRTIYGLRGAGAGGRVRTCRRGSPEVQKHIVERRLQPIVDEETLRGHLCVATTAAPAIRHRVEQQVAEPTVPAQAQPPECRSRVSCGADALCGSPRGCYCGCCPPMPPARSRRRRPS